MTSIYGKGKVCTTGERSKETCKDLDALSKVLQKSRKPDELLAAWKGWHDTVGHAERAAVRAATSSSRTRARAAIGFKDIGDAVAVGLRHAARRSSRPRSSGCGTRSSRSTTQLHCYVRRKLNKKYGDKVVPKTGPIPAHLLGNMWAQEWDNLYTISSRTRASRRSTSRRRSRRSYDAKKMVKIGEALLHVARPRPAAGDVLGALDVRRSPQGKEVVCHASAWDVHVQRTTCASRCASSQNQEDLITIHHELGHDYYFHALLQAAGALPERRERRLPRGDRRHDRAVDDARVPEGERPARQGRRRTTRRRSTSR